MLRCKGTTVKGLKCRAPAVRNGFCLLHSEPGKAAELAARSVDRRRQYAEASRCRALERISAPRTPAEVNAVLRDTLAQIRNGELDLDTARAMSALGQTIFQGYRVVEQEERLKCLEERVGVKE